jgi:hypothetical protein
MKRWIVLSLICGLLIVGHTNLLAQADSPTVMMTRANELYEAGRFSEAAQLYQSLVDAGYQDSNLFYNLGNAYFKQESWAHAILNYRRAQQFAPRDPDIRANLLLARTQTVDQIEVEGVDLLSQITRFAQQWLTLNEMAIAALVLWFGVVILLIVFLRVTNEGLRQGVLYLLILTGILMLGGLLSLGGRLYLEQVRPEGVVVTDEIDVSSGPGSQYIVEFTLHSGTEVSIIEERNSWLRLSLPGGQLQGWVPASAVEPIVIEG